MVVHLSNCARIRRSKKEIVGLIWCEKVWAKKQKLKLKKDMMIWLMGRGSNYRKTPLIPETWRSR